MRTFIAFTIALLVVVSGSSPTTFAQGGRRDGCPRATAPSPPADPRDLQGVWMMRNPPGSNRGFTNYTFTDPKSRSAPR
jgi:hypothetical protein